MSKPEYWWCVKYVEKLLPETARHSPRETSKCRWDFNQSVVRIRIEEVKEKP